MKRNLKEQMKEMKEIISKKRRGNTDANRKFIYVTRVQEEPTGAAMRHVKITAQQTIETNDISLDGITEAVSVYFKEDKKNYVLLLSEKGGRILDISQVDLKKPFFCYFKSGRFNSLMRQSLQSSASSLGNDRHDRKKTSTLSHAHTTSSKSKSVPRSLRPEDVLELGTVIHKKTNIKSYQIEEFHVGQKIWCSLGKYNFLVDETPFERGTFREAFNCQKLSKGLGNSAKFVLKKFNEVEIDYIKLRRKLTVENAVRKCVQMHMLLAKHLAKQLESEAPEEYGDHIKFNNCYLGKGDRDEEWVFFEPFLDGTFVKYVNNNGDQTLSNGGVIMEKVESYAHYSYAKMHKQAIVLDLQGVGMTLTDPEIASTVDRDANDNILFCGGKCKMVGIRGFFTKHICSEYCDMLKLDMAD